ncbi:unknown [Eubacterium sp. CAG:841]|nr:unknown [Eubacterium sp. CAG:841]
MLTALTFKGMIMCMSMMQAEDCCIIRFRMQKNV